MPGAKRIIAFDALRVFAIVSVVAIHTLIPYRDLLSPTAPPRVLDYLLHYAVPLFIFISGAFVWSRPLPSRPGTLRSFMSRRISVVGVPYLAWSAVFLGVVWWQEAEAPALWRIARLLLTGETWYHLYFIPMLIVFYLLTPVASRIAARSPELLLFACYALRIVYIMSLTAPAKALLGGPAWSFLTHVVVHLPEMALGAWFAIRRERVGRNGWLGALLTAIGVTLLLAILFGWTKGLPELAKHSVQPLGMALTVIGMAIMALAFEPLFEKAHVTVTRVGALAFGVYFVHPLFLVLISEYVSERWGEQMWLQPWLPLSVFVSVTAVSFLVAYLLAIFEGTCRLVGLSDALHTLHQRGTTR